MTALRLRLGRLVVPEEDEAVPARRSRRDWIVDSVLFVLAIALGSGSLVSSADHG